MPETTCYVCELEPVVEAVPSRAGALWAVPLCRRHVGDGLALLLRMFPEDVEDESSCEVLRVGQWEQLRDDEADRG